MKKVFRPGTFLSGQTLVVDEAFVRFTAVYGKGFRVPRSEVETVTVDTSRWGRGLLKLVGRGVELAKAEMPLPWCYQAQKWLLEQLKS
jgi:hypothetical protein